MSTPNAAQICRHFELSAAARALLTPDLKPRAYLDLLIAKSHHDDAVMVMAHALPKPEAVWWSCQCLRLALVDTLVDAAAEIVQAAEAWVAKPSDEQRRKTFALAEACGFEPPAGFIGMAVFFSGGSLSLPNLPPVPPKEHLTAGMVGNTVRLAAVAQGGAKAPEFHPQFFALGFDVANGKNRWKES